jgi:drug/metabolite transporter (DMT)-like permease
LEVYWARCCSCWASPTPQQRPRRYLLNLEAVLTAVIAWVVFRENTDRRIVVGMVLIVAGGVVLSWPGGGIGIRGGSGALLIALACASWAIDNNLTRKVSASDAMFIAALKG